MKEKKRDKNIVKEGVADPAFYNDQLGENSEPQKALLNEKERPKKQK